MAFTYRIVKGAPLTHAEIDENFETVEEYYTGLEANADAEIARVTTEGSVLADAEITRVETEGSVLADAEITRVETEGDAIADADIARVTAEGDTQVTRVEAEGDTQAARVEAEGDTQVARVEDEGDTQAARVEDEGDTQAARVEDEGDTQAARVEAEGDTQVARLVRELQEDNIGSVSTNQTLDCSTYNYFILEPTADVTLTLDNVVAGTACIVHLIGAGDHTITWAGGTFVWDMGTAPILATGTGESMLSFISPDGTEIMGKIAYEDL